MMRKVLPAGLAVAALMLTPAVAIAHPQGGGGGEDCCAEGGGANGDAEDCCEEGGGKDGKGGKEGKDGHHGGMGHHGMPGHHGMGHPGMMGWMRDKQFQHEVRYMPTLGTATNQWLVLAGGLGKQKTDWFSMSFQRNLAIQTFNNGPAGFWVAPYCGLMPSIGYSVGEARADLGVLVGGGGMARTANVGGMADVLQARLMWVVEPRLELMWQGEGHGVGVVGTYLVTQHLNDLGGFSFGIKGTWGPKGRGMGHGPRDGQGPGRGDGSGPGRGDGNGPGHDHKPGDKHDHKPGDKH